MTQQTHIYTILGAGGSVGIPLANTLIGRNKTVRLVSRRGTPTTGAVAVKADLSSARETADAVKGSEVVFLCAGLQYRTEVWKELWPKIMTNTIEACKAGNAKLLFLDNVYPYGLVRGRMTEETPYNPCSRKGEIRARIAEQLEREMKSGSLQALIARSADFYGLHATVNSVPYILVIERLRKGLKAQWLLNPALPHSLTYTLDCAGGLALLADDPSAFGQTWHLPTADPPITGLEFIRIAANEVGVEPRTAFLSKWMLKLAGMMNPTIRESYEMIYQNEYDYCFDSGKFNKHFRYTPTSYREGISETIRHDSSG